MKSKKFDGFSHAGCQLASALIEDACVGRRHFSGAACGMIVGGQKWTQYFGWHMSREIDPKAFFTGPESRFDWASLTKSIPVALLVFWAIGQELFKLSTPVSKFFPYLKSSTLARLTIRDLLSYRAEFHLGHIQRPYTGLSQWDLLDIIRKAEFTKEWKFHYGNYHPIILCWILELVTRRSVDSLAREILFEPLGMSNTVYMPNVYDPEHYVATEVNGSGIPYCGTVHDEITRALVQPSGAAGVFGTCDDLLKVPDFLLDGGRSIIPEWLVRQIGINQLPSGETKFGLGFGIWDQFVSGFESMTEHVDAMMPGYSKGAYFKCGFTGVMAVVFPKLDTAIAFLANAVHPKRHEDSGLMNRLRLAVILTLLTGEIPKGTEVLWQKE